jgi:hypothetical protein
MSSNYDMLRFGFAMIHHKFLLLLVLPVISFILFLTVGCAGVAVEKLQKWCAFFAWTGFAVSFLLFVRDNPYADVARFLFFSFTLSVALKVWLERPHPLRKGG